MISNNDQKRLMSDDGNSSPPPESDKINNENSNPSPSSSSINNTKNSNISNHDQKSKSHHHHYRYIIYFLIYSIVFWTLYFIYQYKNNQEFKQEFIKWYLATFHHKSSSTSNIGSSGSSTRSSKTMGNDDFGEFKVDFTTYKLPYKSSGGSHAKDYFKFTQEELKHYNGKNPNLPILMAIKGRVYDVSEGKSYYGMGGGYHFFAGRDGTRSFVTGCFDEEKEECTSVQSKYSDFDKGQMQSIDDWVKFYDDHEKYKFIGIVTDLKDQ